MKKLWGEAFFFLEIKCPSECFFHWPLEILFSSFSPLTCVQILKQSQRWGNKTALFFSILGRCIQLTHHLLKHSFIQLVCIGHFVCYSALILRKYKSVTTYMFTSEHMPGLCSNILQIIYNLEIRTQFNSLKKLTSQILVDL